MIDLSDECMIINDLWGWKDDCRKQLVSAQRY